MTQISSNYQLFVKFTYKTCKPNLKSYAKSGKLSRPFRTVLFNFSDFEFNLISIIHWIISSRLRNKKSSRLFYPKWFIHSFKTEVFDSPRSSCTKMKFDMQRDLIVTLCTLLKSTSHCYIQLTNDNILGFKSSCLLSDVKHNLL